MYLSIERLITFTWINLEQYQLLLHAKERTLITFSSTDHILILLTCGLLIDGFNPNWIQIQSDGTIVT